MSVFMDLLGFLNKFLLQSDDSHNQWIVHMGILWQWSDIYGHTL